MATLTPAEIDKLPTITEVLNTLERAQRNFAARGGWLQMMPELRMFQQTGLDNPYSSLFNGVASDTFIVNRLASGRYCCKPNIAYTPFLFRGEKKKHPSVVSAFNRTDDKDDKLFYHIQEDKFRAEQKYSRIKQNT